MSNDVLALLIILLIPVAAVGLVVSGYLWARDAVRRSPLLGALGVLCTGVAAANLLVERACANGSNRPVVAMVLSDDACHRAGVISLEVVLLLAVATSAAVRLRDVRR